MSRMGLTVEAAVHSDKPAVRVFRAIRKWVEKGDLPEGEHLPSEQELADRFGVSRTAVRAGLKRLEDERWIARFGRGRIVCARKQRTPSILGNTVLLLSTRHMPSLPAHWKTTGWQIHVELGAQEALRLAGAHVLVLQPQELSVQDLAQLIEQRPKGAIAIASDRIADPMRQAIEHLKRAGIPVVLHHEWEDLTSFDRVRSDQASGAAALTRFLGARGCRRIRRVWSGNWPADRPPQWLRQRDNGYLRACQAAGLEVLDAIQVAPHEFPGLRGEALFEARARFLAGYLLEALNGPAPADALMVASDGALQTVFAACRLLGKEPQRDIAIVGYDDYWSDLAEAGRPAPRPLATVDKENPRIGEALVALLNDRIAGRLPEAPQERVVEPRLVVPAEPATTDSLLHAYATGRSDRPVAGENDPHVGIAS